MLRCFKNHLSNKQDEGSFKRAYVSKRNSILPLEIARKVMQTVADGFVNADIKSIVTTKASVGVFVHFVTRIN